MFLLLFSQFANANKSPHLTEKLKIEFPSEQAVKTFLNSSLPEEQVSQIFDYYDGTKLIINLLNDFEFKDPNTSDVNSVNDDIGLTHGLKLEIYKNIAPSGNHDKYYLLISYETFLYTNSVDPQGFQTDYRDLLYDNEEGISQADVYFKESNRFNILINSIRKENAFFWSAGIGYQEINSEDYDRGFLLSSVTQQSWQHKNLNKWSNGKYREYNYLKQDIGQYGFYIMGSVGHDVSIFKSKSQRTFVRAELSTELSQIDDASYIGTKLSVGHDYNPEGKKWYNIPLRVQSTYKIEKYLNANNYQEFSLEIKAEFKAVSASFKYIVPLSQNPDYLNPLPLDFEERDLSINRPEKEPILWFTLEGKL